MQDAALIIEGVIDTIARAPLGAESITPTEAGEIRLFPAGEAHPGMLWDGQTLSWPEPADPEAPAAYYIAQVTFERRLSSVAYDALDKVRLQIRNRPADYQTTGTAPWPATKAWVRGFNDYDGSTRINVLDPAIPSVIGAVLQASGFSPQDIAAELAHITQAVQLEGEPAGTQ